MPKDEVTLSLGGGESASASAPGGTIGRFIVERTLGSGGMGVVVAARDPNLERTVAIKLLRSGGDEEGRTRLGREAQAMARVQHPNVATVFEVGTVGEQLFVAMELVDGPTLKGWLRERPRGWREILRLFAAAGRGLEAVHAAGLVHRDFKPDNVILGSDGRPRVSDFGLVGSGGKPDALGSGSVTLSHGGTPGYMAPEQLRGETCDARSDQFSFCVALYQALYGERPFPDDAPEEARRAPTARPKKGEVPARLFDVLARGLQHDPAARFPTMDALLVELQHDPAVAWRRLGLMAAVILVLGAGGFGLWRARAARCEGARQRLTGIWDAAARETVHKAFAASKVSFAEDSFVRAASLIDSWTNNWVAMHEEACRATRVEGRQSDALMDLREACLDQQRGALSALVKLWSGGMDMKAVEKAIAAAGALPPLAECADAKALTERAPLPRDPASRARIEAVRAQLDQVRALMSAGRLKEAQPEAEAARKEADAIGWPQVRAEATYQLGLIYGLSVDGRAEAMLTEASALAQSARDDRLAAVALIDLVETLAENLHVADRALMAAGLAEGAVERAGGGDELRGQLEASRAAIYLDQGKYDEAKRLFEQAKQHLIKNDLKVREIDGQLARVAGDSGDYVLARKLFQEHIAKLTETVGPDHSEVGIALNNYGAMLDSATDFAAALDAYQRSVAIIEKAYGPDNGKVGAFLINVASAQWALGHLEDAAHTYERSIAISTKVRGADTVDVAMTSGNLSGLRLQQGRYDEGLKMAEHTLAVVTKTLGPNHPNVAFAEDEIADALKEKGDLESALEHQTRAYELRKKVLPPNHIFTLGDEESIANIRCRQKRYAEGIAGMRTVLPLVQKAIGPEQSYVGQVESDLGRCLADAGRFAEAKDALAKALAISKKSAMPPGTIAAIHFQEARVEYLSGQRAEGLVAAHAAEKELVAAAWSQSDIREARTFLATHH
jgi:tetratricopeptide (TPR) repeat protein